MLLFRLNGDELFKLTQVVQRLDRMKMIYSSLWMKVQVQRLIVKVGDEKGRTRCKVATSICDLDPMQLQCTSQSGFTYLLGTESKASRISPATHPSGATDLFFNLRHSKLQQCLIDTNVTSIGTSSKLTCIFNPKKNECRYTIRLATVVDRIKLREVFDSSSISISAPSTWIDCTAPSIDPVSSHDSKLRVLTEDARNLRRKVCQWALHSTPSCDADGFVDMERDNKLITDLASGKLLRLRVSKQGLEMCTARPCVKAVRSCGNRVGYYDKTGLIDAVTLLFPFTKVEPSPSSIPKEPISISTSIDSSGLLCFKGTDATIITPSR